MKPVYLHDPGMINALGCGVDEVSRGLFEGSSAGMVTEASLLSGLSTRVGRVALSLPPLPEKFRYLDSRNARLLYQTLMQIKAPLDDMLATWGPERVGLVLGGSTSGVAEGGEALAVRMQTGTFPVGYAYATQEISAISTFACDYLGIKGPRWTVSTACTASAKAFASARRLLNSGLCDAVVVGGVDTLAPMTLNGFDALGAVSPYLCQPFSCHRQGINIGEGAAVFIMSHQPSEVALLGVGESSDAYHISAPDPSGQGAIKAMQDALKDAAVQVQDVGYVNLHGTATLQNDAMEAKAVYEVFADKVACSSTKPLVGHTLGAAGATETAFCWLSLARQPLGLLPPHMYDGEYDEDLPRLHLCALGERSSKSVMMSNSFAFGGSNASVVLGHG